MKLKLATALAVAVLAVPATESKAGTHWVTTWGASTQPDSRRTLTNLTIRQVVHISVGGTKVRLRISNAFGGYPAAPGDAALTFSDPGHLANGAFALLQPLVVELAKAAWTAPTANEAVPITFRQRIDATDALRTGAYSRTLVFTLSTTTP
jgi:hypothetical protein